MKRAISLIELILSIVIIGLVVSAIPTVLTRTNDNNEFSLRQDAILAAITKIKGVTSHEWDHHSYNVIDGKSYILNTTSPNATLNSRPGLTKQSGRRSYTPGGTAVEATPIGGKPGATIFDDIDDFNGQSEAVAHSVITTNLDKAGGLDYIFKDDMRINTTVSYTNDSTLNFSGDTAIVNFATAPLTSGTSNIKLVSVAISIDNENIAALQTYSYNIGESSVLEPREF